MVVVVPVATFDGLTTSLAGLVLVTYLAVGAGHFLAVIALERKWLENLQHQEK